MEAYMPVLMEQMKIIASLMFIGFAEQKLKLFNDALIDSLSAIITKLIIPLMLCTVIGSVSRTEITEGLRILVAAVLMYVITLAAAKFISRFYHRIQEPQKSMLCLLQCFGNSGYVGAPLIMAIFPENAGIAAAVYITVDSFFCWVIAPVMAGNTKVSFKKFVSPITISIFIGFIIVLLNLNLEGNIFWETMTNVGGTCKYFASIYIGMAIGRTKLSRLKNDMSAATAAPVKLLLIPVIAYLIFGKTGFLSGETLIMFIILCATPSGMSLPIVADIAGVDSREYAVSGVVISTVLCLVTIPFIVWLVQII